MTPLEKVLGHLGGVRQTGGQHLARCPAHDDHKASLSVTEGADGRVLLCCHAGCSTKEVVEAMELAMSDLFPTKHSRFGKSSKSRKIIYPVRDGSGNLVAEHVRREDSLTGKKQRMWWQRNGRKGLSGLKTQDLPLYRSETVAQAEESARVYIHEGEKAADAAASLGLVSLGTVTGANGTPSAEVLDGLRGRQILLLPDNDDPGRRHMHRLAAQLSDIAAKVQVLELPDLPEKGDVADWIDGRSLAGVEQTQIREELERLADRAGRSAVAEPTGHGNQATSYRSTPEGLIWMKPLKDGPVPVQLTNFKAEIVADGVHDDGVETSRSFEIRATHGGQVRRFQVSASRFNAMGWVAQHLGPTAFVNAGFGTKDHARVAIQSLSPNVRRQTTYTHTGWRSLGGTWCYLHAGGAIGPNGPVPDVKVTLPDGLRGYELPPPPGEDSLCEAIGKSLDLLDLVPDEISLPLYAAIWRAAMRPGDFSLHLSGQTGEGKSELAALAQQHFGGSMNARRLPGSWSSTANSLEILAFSAKDALLVVDDFAPEGTQFDVQRMQREAARLFRAQGNRSSRGRLRPDGTLRLAKSPRGLILSTGEDVPKAQSVRARVPILDLPRGAMRWDLLTPCQEAASSGVYALAMAGFLQWLATEYEGLHDRCRRRATDLRAEMTVANVAHRRVPSIVAELAVAFELFLQFGKDVGALDEAVADELWQRGWSALGKAAGHQAEYQMTAEPTARFLELLRSALVAGRAHVASERGESPEYPTAWGWRRVGEILQPQGSQVGWIRGTDLFLDPDASYRAAQQMASRDDGIAIQHRTLWKRMRERDLLVTTDGSRGRNLIRVVLQSARRTVLHVDAGVLMPKETAQPAQKALGVEHVEKIGPIPGAGSRDEGGKPAQPSGPFDPCTPAVAPAPGPDGPIGTVPSTKDEADDWGEL